MGHGIDHQKHPIFLRNHRKGIHDRACVEPDQEKGVRDLTDIPEKYVDARKDQSDSRRKQDLEYKSNGKKQQIEERIYFFKKNQRHNKYAKSNQL
jgi:hypothetical protein